ncbi:MAG TPA: uroporphyrinogen-III C-methyltransferase [Polyangiaceae bacterium]|nr:uroporphyrinogen-III C-methyltransferase [Polyangiaceae bacterium]
MRGEGVVPRRPRGKVWLVGAGPGDPDLLTVKAARLLASCEVLAYDELVSPEILALAPASAERVPVGRRAAGVRHHDARIHPVVLARALEGRDVVRLKGGDPLVFGRGGEEAEELAAARIPFEFVPGITAALGAAASARVPLTHRDCASQVTLLTAHAAEPPAGAPPASGRAPAAPGDPPASGRAPAAPGAPPASPPGEGTLVIYMGLSNLEALAANLVARGRPPETPALVVSRATTPAERRVTGTLASIAGLVREARLEPPALLIVGEVVAHAVESPESAEPLPPLALVPLSA